jgi:transglutaminase-like putative cysteine protease
MVRARLVHAITYRFAEPVAGADLALRLTPRELPDQRVEHHQLLVDPPPAARAAERDAHGNAVERVEIRAPFRALSITAISTVARDPLDLPAAAREAATALLAQAGIHVAVPAFPDAPRGGPGACRAIADAVSKRLAALGIACRYLAGYPLSQRRGRTQPHAWVSFQVPDHGFIEFDGTRGELAPCHAVIGWGNGYDDVAPIAGSLAGSGRYRLSSEVTQELLKEDNRHVVPP